MSDGAVIDFSCSCGLVHQFNVLSTLGRFIESVHSHSRCGGILIRFRGDDYGIGLLPTVQGVETE